MIGRGDEGRPAFLGALTGRDRNWVRVLGMAALAPAAVVLFSILLAFGGALYQRATGVRVFEFGPGTGPLLARSAGFTLAVSAGLVIAAVAILLSASLVFRRPLRSWITSGPRFRWGLLVLGAGWSAMGILLEGFAASAITGPGAGDPTPPFFAAGVTLAQQLRFAAFVVPALAAAAAAEEAVFRGYLLQQQAAFTRRLWLAMLLNGLVFAAVHMEFHPGALAVRTLMGMVFAYSALRLGGLEFAIGAHAANNLVIVFLGQPLLPDMAETRPTWAELGQEALIFLWIAAGVEIVRRRRQARGAAG